MAMSRSQVGCVFFFLGLLLVGCQGQMLGRQRSSAEEMMSYDPRRSLAGSPYYISYGSLNANRAPCPSGQGRSYYTASCQPTGGDAQPYVRSCTQIARCARG
ncbi:hypothetical protein M758_5G058700 [Ceratodon purpureus]|nr:hypothetical protein M758_5G058700 [Ceratodon purpureus]